MDNIDFEAYGKKCYLQNEIYRLEGKKAGLKNELLKSLNEPMNALFFEKIANKMLKTLKEIERLKNELEAINFL
ncbi:hypothetical protein [Campylobacter gastrosuis]|uniref:DUF115 domain-containing protein n=1 Tax=Campylobacter gastrosuis TaxID=2974576 RepID=A0ABT7HSQ7_9BACT|nr:hypothetical protein [Campylobacter gastrosuis]MDL0089956.1 hypothetical protein [Campylobacter gastrosuis]